MFLNVDPLDKIRTQINSCCSSDGFLNVCHANARSIVNKTHEFNAMLSETDLHAILITESWLHSGVSSQLVKIDNFILFRHDRMGKIGGGVAIYLRNGIKSRALYHSKEGPIEFLVVEISTPVNKCALCVIYSPPSCFSQDNLQELEYCFLKLSNMYANVLVGGDFNVNLLNVGLQRDNFIHFFQRFNLSVVNSKPTFFNTANPSQLDLFLVSDLSLSMDFNQISPPSFLDHDIIIVKYAFNLNPSNERSKFMYRDFSNINYSTLYIDCENIDWVELYESDSIDTKVKIFNDKISELYDKYVPIKTAYRNFKPYPWFSNEVRALICEREFLYCRYKKCKTPELRDQYKKVRNKINSLIKRLKFLHFSPKLDPSLPAKTIWSNLRHLGVYGKENNECDLNPDHLNQSFLTSSQSSLSEFASIPYRPINENCDNFSFTCASLEDVYKAIFSIKSNAVGPDGINPRFIKIIFLSISSALCHIFNSCLTFSKFPTLWKEACVLPIPKKANCSEPSDYRPISILCFLSKVLEKLMFSQIVSFLDRKDLLTPWQSGFRSSHSCETALVKVSSDIRRFVDEGDFVIITLLDFSKAFDSVSHPLLLYKLVNSFEFSSSAISLVSDFLLNRQQKVKVKNRVSRLLKVTKGVPQGSLLGPLFFSLFINDLPQLCKYCYIHLYADDVQLYLSGKYSDPLSLVNKINYDLAIIWNWSVENHLILNPSKSQCMVVGNLNKLQIKPIILLNNKQLDIVEKVRNLGVMMNSNMTCCDHINAKLCKIYGGLRSLRLTSGSLTREMRLKLVRALLVPHFLYGCVVYPALDSHCARKLDVAFNDCIRFIYGLPRFAHISMYRSVILGCSLDNYLSFRCLLLFFKVLFTSKPAYLRSLINIFASTRQNLIKLPTFYKLIGERSYFVYTPRLWNGLPRHIQRASSFGSFREQLWSHISQSPTS